MAGIACWNGWENRLDADNLWQMLIEEARLIALARMA